MKNTKQPKLTLQEMKRLLQSTLKLRDETEDNRALIRADKHAKMRSVQEKELTEQLDVLEVYIQRLEDAISRQSK